MKIKAQPTQTYRNTMKMCLRGNFTTISINIKKNWRNLIRIIIQLLESFRKRINDTQMV